MIEDIITFGDTEFEKHKFHYYKCPMFLEDVDIDNVLVSNKISSGEKNYSCMMIIKLSHYINLPETSVYIKSYDGETKWMHFLIEDDDLLKKCNTIWDKVSSNVKKEFDSKLVYYKKRFFENQNKIVHC